MLQRLQHLLSRITRFLTWDVWHLPGESQNQSPGLFTFIRVILISVEGVLQNRITTQAASLSFFSLIGLGPVLAISVMISGFVFKDANTDAITAGIDRAIEFIAPPAAEFERYEQSQKGPQSESTTREDGDLGPGQITRINPKVVEVIERIIQSSQSGAVGVVGVIVLLMICMQLLTSIESSFNSIWGIRRGRSFQHRLILYWTLITLGAAVLFTSMTIRIAPTVERFLSQIPFLGQLIFSFGLTVSPLFSFLLVSFVLALFFRFIPNTRVNWVPALTGGVFVSLLLYLNNYLSFLYIQRAIVGQSLYGSIGIIPILMLGLFIFWLFILLGGQLTYAIQNVNQLTSKNAWGNISAHGREVVSLAAFLEISRRFHACDEGPTPDELSARLRTPIQILNLSLNHLEEGGWVSAVEVRSKDGQHSLRFQPGKPLSHIRLNEVRSSFARQGNNTGADLLLSEDPILKRLFEVAPGQVDWENEDFETLFERFSPADSAEQSPAKD